MDDKKMTDEEAIKVCEGIRDDLGAHAVEPGYCTDDCEAKQKYSDALSTLLQTVRDYKEMENAADQVRGLENATTLKWSLEKFNGQWLSWTYQKPAEQKYDSLLEAFSEVRGGR